MIRSHWSHAHSCISDLPHSTSATTEPQTCLLASAGRALCTLALIMGCPLLSHITASYCSTLQSHNFTVFLSHSSTSHCCALVSRLLPILVTAVPTRMPSVCVRRPTLLCSKAHMCAQCCVSTLQHLISYLQEQESTGQTESVVKETKTPQNY